MHRMRLFLRRRWYREVKFNYLKFEFKIFLEGFKFLIIFFLKTIWCFLEAWRPLTSHVTAAGVRLQEQCQSLKILLLSCLLVSLSSITNLLHINIKNIKAPLNIDIITKLIISQMFRLRNKTGLSIQSITTMFYKIGEVTKS